MLESEEVEVLEDTACCFGPFLVVLEGHPVVSGALHVVGPHDLLPAAAGSVLHEEDVVALIDLPVLNGEHPVGLSDECLRVVLEVLVKLLYFCQQEEELILGESLEDEAVVGGKEEELSTSPPVAIYDVVQLVPILQQSEASPNLADSILLQQPTEHSWSHYSKLPPQERYPRQQLCSLLIILDQLGSDLEADFLLEVQTLEFVLLRVEGLRVVGGEVLLVCDFDAGEDGDDLRDADEVDLALLLLDVQDLLLHADVDEVDQLPLVEPLLLHRQRTLHVHFAEQPSEQLLHLLPDLFVSQHHPDQVEELEKAADIEDSGPHQHHWIGRKAVEVKSEGGSSQNQQDDGHSDHKPRHHAILLKLPAVQRHSLRHVSPVVSVGEEGEADESH